MFLSNHVINLKLADDTVKAKQDTQMFHQFWWKIWRLQWVRRLVEQLIVTRVSISKKKNGHKSITARMSYCYRFSSLAYALSLWTTCEMLVIYLFWARMPTMAAQLVRPHVPINMDGGIVNRWCRCKIMDSAAAGTGSLKRCLSRRPLYSEAPDRPCSVGN